MEQVPVLLHPKTCKACSQVKRIMDFYGHKDSNCKTCICTKKMKNYRKNNPEKRKWSSNWHRTNMEY